MNDLTRQVHDTIAVMIADFNFRREQSGMVDAPVSPEMQTAMELNEQFELGRIAVVRC